MKTVAILPRKYYAHNGINYTAGQKLEVEDDEAYQMIEDEIASIEQDVNHNVEEKESE